MNTEFKFYDEDGSLKEATLIMAFDHNQSKYIIYELKKEENSENDILYIREYKLINNEVHLYKVNNREFREIKRVVNALIDNIKE